MQPEKTHQPVRELLKQDTVFQGQYEINQKIAPSEHAENFEWMHEYCLPDCSQQGEPHFVGLHFLRV